ncbi:MAG TPA: hypothetical protein VF738_14860, partial [Rhodanobacter sp.]
RLAALTGMLKPRSLADATALIYACTVGAASIWAWYIDLTMLHSEREHLAPAILLAFLSLPTSKILEPLCGQWPNCLQTTLAELTLLTLCGAFQVAVFYLLCRLSSKARNTKQRRT